MQNALFFTDYIYILESCNHMCHSYLSVIVAAFSTRTINHKNINKFTQDTAFQNTLLKIGATVMH
jgi:hypothetical protein